MDVKEATRTALDYIYRIFASEEISQVGLEEVVLEPNTKQWRVTFGFSRSWDPQNTVAVNLSLKASRTYKVVIFDDDSGSVTGLIDSLLPSPASCCNGRCVNAKHKKNGRGVRRGF